MTIHVLPAEIAAKIAAGEVIERPASAVKELIENALDAGAQRITVELEGGGLALIRVTDDGHGLAAEEIPLAFMRHATSKLSQSEDLARVTTLGFRGEALPSLAAAADVEFASRPAGQIGGGRIRLAAGQIVEERAYAGAPGTVVIVRDLFERQPARRKFLRAPAAEATQITALVARFAIAYPEVAFTLVSDRRRSLATPGNGELREAVGRVYGAETAAAMLEIDPEGRDGIPTTVHGLISPPGLTRANRSYINVFVNRRLVQAPRLLFATEQAYQSTLMHGRHPIAILNLRLPPGEVDVNVHPTKSEVRFLREREVSATVHRSVRDSLVLHAPIPNYGVAQAPMQTNGETTDAAISIPLWQALARPEEHDKERMAASTDPARPGLPIMRVVGQTGGLYIVAEGPDGMYLVDQHAAHERVLYEKLVQQQAGQTAEVQGLLSPVSVELTAAQAAVLAADGELLRNHGFELEPFGAEAYLLRSVPAMLARKDPARTLIELLDDLITGTDPADRPAQVTMTVACHAAVTAGMTLSIGEMRELLQLLETCELPRTCPHGRPTMVHLSNAALEREFRRR